MESFNLSNFTVRIFHSETSYRRVQCSRVGLEVKICDTPAGGGGGGGISASQGTLSSFMENYS